VIRPLEPFLHVDLDAFYAGVEVLKDPTLKGKPVIVGGTGSRGVVASASYEARAFGVRSAMPAVRARRLCPDGVFLPADFDAYRAHSNRFREVLLAHTPLVEPISLDEAFLDVGGATRLFGEPVAIATKIRADVAREVGVTCSVGVAATKFVAKIASDLHKPDNLVHVPVEETLAFLEPLPVGRLWGVGEKTGDLLGRLAIRTVGDLARTPRPVLERLLGEATAAHLTALAHGIDERDVVPYEPPKSVGHEETFERDLDDDEEIFRELLHLSGRVAARLREDGYRARTVTLKARLASFTTLTRAKTLPDPTDVGAELYHVARTIDRIEARFGRGAATHATLLDRERGHPRGPSFRGSEEPRYHRP
jgi:DNA polymerase-4